MNRLIFPLVSATLLLCGCGSSERSSTTAATGTAAKTSSTSTHSHLTVDAAPAFAAPSPSAPVVSGLVKVAYHNFAINPDVLRVRAGSTIQWTNEDPTDHNVTSQSGPQPFASKDFGEGATFRVHLTHPGIYHYECTLHPATMNGTIQVLR
jgi:plastocyanin